MVIFYCPACWQEIPEEDRRCPVCGFDLSKDQALSFEGKLLRTLEHPVQENRLLAIQILGNLGSQAAVPALEKLLQNPQTGVYDLQETLVALSKIQGPRSRELIEAAREHPYLVIRSIAEDLLAKRKSRRKPLPGRKRAGNRFVKIA